MDEKEKMILVITITEEILEENPDLREYVEPGDKIQVESDRPPKPPHNG